MFSPEQEKTLSVVFKATKSFEVLHTLMKSMTKANADVAKAKADAFKHHKPKFRQKSVGGAGGADEAGEAGDADGAGGVDSTDGTGGDVEADDLPVRIDKNGVVIDHDTVDHKLITFSKVCIQGLIGVCYKCEGGKKCRAIRGPRKYLCEVAKSTKKNLGAVASLLDKPEKDALRIINQFMKMSDEEFAFACKVNSVCFYTVSTSCSNEYCKKKYCKDQKDKIQEVILGSIVGIERFANFMNFDSLEKVAVHFKVDPESVSVLVKYLAEEASA
jgi:hypothetical protein